VNSDGSSLCPELEISDRDSLVSGHPHSVFIPDHYEPGYAYPSITFLHDSESSELKLGDWFPNISERNFIGIGVRAPFPVNTGMPGQYQWSVRRPDSSLGAIRETHQNVSEWWTLNPEKMFLMGEGIGAIIALQAFYLQQSGLMEGFSPIAGVICRNLPENWTQHLPALYGVGGGRILMMDEISQPSEAAVVDQLRESGVEFTHAAVSEELVASTINEWCMNTISTTIH